MTAEWKAQIWVYRLADSKAVWTVEHQVERWVEELAASKVSHSAVWKADLNFGKIKQCKTETNEILT